MRSAAWPALAVTSFGRIIVVSISPMLGTSTQARDGINVADALMLPTRSARIGPQ